MYGINNDTNGRWGVFATGHTHCVCGAEHQPIGDHNNIDEKTFTEWTDTLAEKQNEEGNTASNSLPATAGNYYLTKDVVISETWEPVNGTVLCLNGKKISMNAAGNAISVGKDKTFILTDCTEAQGSITHGTNLETKYTGRGMNVAGIFTMYGGNITGNNRNVTDLSNGGSGVYVGAGATFTMNGGSVAENIIISEKTYANGGGVYVAGSFVINGGNIIKNEAEFGGGVYVAADAHLIMNGGNIIKNEAEFGGGVYVAADAHLIMNGGNIIKNEAEFGGGVYVVRTDRGKEGTLTMSGGNIVGNTAIGADAKGGGVYNAASIEISGNVQIKDNLKKNSEQDAGTANNLYLFKVATITDKIGNDANIGVTSSDKPVKNKPIAITNAYNTNYSGYFHSDNKQYKAYYDDDDNIIKLKLLSAQSNFKFADKNVTKTYGETFTNAATGVAEGSTVTYSSSNEKVATVDNDGAVTATGAGTAIITATALETDEYAEATASYNLTVSAKELAEEMIANIDAQTYTGSEIKPDVTVTDGDKTLIKGIDYDVVYTKNTNVGTGEAIVTGQGNYSGSVTKNFVISAKQEADVIAPEIRVLAGEKREVDLSSYKRNDTDVIGDTRSNDDVFDKSIPPHKVQGADKVGFTVKSDATVGDSGIITANVESADGNTYYTIQLKVTVRSKSSGGTYKPPVQKPSITAGEGFKAELSSDGTKATITVEEGYEIVDVLVNGISKGKVTEITGLKTGDTIEVKTEKKQTEPVKPADNKRIIKGVKNTEIELETTVNKDGNIVIKWKKSKGYRVDSFEILRAVKKNGKYSKIYTTKSGKASRIVNAKNLKDGKRYYYKVRGVRTIDGKKYYTEWSNTESEKVNK